MGMCITLSTENQIGLSALNRRFAAPTTQAPLVCVDLRLGRGVISVQVLPLLACVDEDEDDEL